jgi:1-deoxy-D-xylulose-5-phosphate synthase
MTPSDENECRKMLTTGFQYPGVSAVRYPRGSGSGALIESELTPIEIGKGQVVRNGKNIAILAFGSMLAPALKAAESIDATVANMRFVKPIDAELIEKLANTHSYIVTVEENCIMGGAGSAVMEALQAMQKNIALPVKTLCLGLPDLFIEHGVHETMLPECGLDAEGIADAIAQLIT